MMAIVSTASEIAKKKETFLFHWMMGVPTFTSKNVVAETLRRGACVMEL